jgi:hypothetical protein
MLAKETSHIDAPVARMGGRVALTRRVEWRATGSASDFGADLAALHVSSNDPISAGSRPSTGEASGTRALSVRTKSARRHLDKRGSFREVAAVR